MSKSLILILVIVTFVIGGAFLGKLLGKQAQQQDSMQVPSADDRRFVDITSPESFQNNTPDPLTIPLGSEESFQEEEVFSEPMTDQADESVAVSVKSDYLGSYDLIDQNFGTEVSVKVSTDIRTIVANALPNHETGDFPSSGNPNTISEQNNTYTFPLNPTWNGTGVWAREPGVAINGVKFEPETAEQVQCSSGETYRIEAIQDLADLGLDFNNAHVQPDGTYHYHGVADKLVEVFDQGADLVHVGFAADGYLMYYSKSKAYTPSYTLASAKREGSSCSYRNQNVNIEGAQPDGTYVSDWVYDEGLGNLDKCNGAIINGTYAYLITDEYPYVSRCLNGSFTEAHPGGGQGQPGSQQGPPSGQPMFPPPRR